MIGIIFWRLYRIFFFKDAKIGEKMTILREFIPLIKTQILHARDPLSPQSVCAKGRGRMTSFFLNLSVCPYARVSNFTNS